jgi:PPOX class probable F420-dependent enzyme
MDRNSILRRPLVAVFAVVRPDGRVHVTPLWFLWDGAAISVIVERNSPRHLWAARAGRAAICIEAADETELAFVTGEGPVEIIDPLPIARRYELWERYRGASRAHEVVDAGGHDTKVLIRLKPEIWVPSRN